MSEMPTLNVKTIKFGKWEEKKVEFEQSFMGFWVKNMGGPDIFASLDGGLFSLALDEDEDEDEDTACWADGVIRIDCGEATFIARSDLAPINCLYLCGDHTWAQILGTNNAECPFVRF